MIDHCVRYFYVVEQSPVIVAVCYKPYSHRVDREMATALGGEESTAAWSPTVIGIGMAAQNLLLAAHALGLGACYHSGPIPFLRGPLHELLDIHPRLELAGLITIGWPRDGSPGAPPNAAKRKDLSRLVRYVRLDGRLPTDAGA
jgi:nitroreductase